MARNRDREGEDLGLEGQGSTLGGKSTLAEVSAATVTGSSVPVEGEEENSGEAKSGDVMSRNSEERKAQEVLQKHEEYLQSITTSRSLRQLKSTIAGAGGHTMVEYRRDREREAARREKLAQEELRSVEQDLVAKEKAARVQALREEEGRRQKKRDKKKKAKKNRKRERHTDSDDSSGDRSGSDDSEEVR